MLKKLSWLTFAIILTVTATFSSCKKKHGQVEFNEGFKAYIYAYTSGVISRASPIRIRFNESLVDSKEIGNEVKSGVLTFEPSISGQAIWEDDKTIKFVADENLPSGEPYFGRVDLTELYGNVPKDLRTFLFDFKTKIQFFEVAIEGLRSVSQTDLTQQKLVGTITTADVAENDKVEEILSASQKGNNDLELTWQHDGDGLHHHFILHNVARKDDRSKVELSWTGKPIRIKNSGEETVEVPALGDFEVSSVSLMEGEEQAILVEFSDPISKRQDIEGFITIENVSTALNHVIDGNTVRVYPASRLAGEQKINISRGVKNVAGRNIKKPSEWYLEFAEIAPEVKLVGNGVIIPNTDKGLILPFDAVSLNAIDVEVFKIYENNVLQFLQTNDLDGDYQLERVGRVVFQKKISLQDLKPMANFKVWSRFALDLNKLIQREPNAIYQVRLGFQQSYSTYFCSGTEPNSNDGMTIYSDRDNKDEYGEIKSFWDNDYNYYDWENRNNPCHEAYYKSYYRKERFANANVIASDLGLIAKRGNDNSYFVAVSDLKTTNPLRGIKVKFYDYQQQVIKEIKTDSDGTINVKLKKKPYFVVAEQGQQRGYLKLEDGRSLSLSRYDVAGQRPHKGIKGFIYGERGVWRPGDSLYLSFILEDKLGNLPASHPVTFELFNPRGQLQEKTVKTENIQHIYSFHTATSADAPTGNWQAKVTVGGATFTKRIRIETVKPNRLKINLDFGKNELVADESLEGKLQVNWLHGAAARDIKTEVKVQLRSTKTEFKNYGDYAFDDPARSFSGSAQTIFNNNTDDDGKALVTTKISTNDAAPGKMKANFSIRAYEKSGDFSSDNFSMPYNPYDGYVGLRIPTKRNGEKRLDINKSYNINVVSLSANGRVRSNKNLKVGLYRVNWRWWWDSGSDNVSNYSSSSHYGALEKANLKTNSKGQAAWNIKIDDWGRYLVRVCDEETGHCTGDIFYAGYPWDDENNANKQAAAMLTFSSDKTKYNVGETVQLKVPLSQSGRALITIENGTKVLQSFWKEAKAGDNTFSFYATKDMAPNVYAHVTLVQPHAQVENDLPIRMYGVLPIMIEDPKTRLEPQIAMKSALRPNETFTVKVSEKSRKPMAYTLAIVDEGLLGLTRFKTPDPWNHFYAKEALGVQTWDMYDHVMGAYTGKLERILSIGGDAALGPREGQKANRFTPVVKFLGPFYLKSGTKTHQVTMPNYIGSVRVMVVAAKDGAYGNSEKTVSVKKPLMVLGTMPRVLSPGENVKLPVTVFAMENNIKNVNVKIETNGLLSIISTNRKTLKFKKTGDKVVNFDMIVPENTGVATVKIIATSGSESATQEIELDVRNPNPYVTDVYAGIVEKGKSWTKSFKPIGMEGTNSATLEVSNIPPINLGERLQYLLQYPHGCIEQTTSSGFPQLYVNTLLEVDKKTKAKTDQNIKATIDRLKQFQTTSGGFGYWPGDGEASSWGTTYAGHFMVEAKDLGFTLPPSMLSKWKKYQRKIAKTWNGNNGRYDNSDLEQAYRLYTLAIADAPEWGAMNRLKERPNLSTSARWRLAAAYAAAGKKSVAKSLTKNLKTYVKSYNEMGGSYGSDLRDRAMILETLTLIGEKTRAAAVLKKVAAELSKKQWLSTQTTAYALLAVGKYVGNDNAKGSLAFTYTLGGKSVKITSKNPMVQINFNPEQASKVTVKNTSGGMLFANIISTGQPKTGDQQPAASSNLKLAVSYKTLDGKAIDPTSIKQGTDFMAEVTITNPGELGTYNEMALMQIFPAGWEIHNTRMDNISAFSNTSIPEYQDIRDDRVYSYFDLKPNKTHTYRIQLNAAYQGRYYLPTVACSAMYDESVSARIGGEWISVIGNEIQ